MIPGIQTEIRHCLRGHASRASSCVRVCYCVYVRACVRPLETLAFLFLFDPPPISDGASMCACGWGLEGRGEGFIRGHLEDDIRGKEKGEREESKREGE